jgi:hypothetical protein
MRPKDIGGKIQEKVFSEEQELPAQGPLERMSDKLDEVNARRESGDEEDGEAGEEGDEGEEDAT